MEELSQEEKAYFESGGETEVVETPEETPEVIVTEAPKVEAPKVEEKKKPSKFEYSESTDNVVDDLGRKYVPLGAVQEARNENKTLRRQLEELEGKWKGGEEKLNKLLSKFDKPEDTPDPEKDPLGHLKHKNFELEQKLKAIEDNQGEIKKEKETNTKFQEFSAAVTSAERSFASQNPDYAEAVAVVQNMWRAEYEAAGMPEQFIESALARKGAQFSHAAMQKEQNPAEAVYKLAGRYGYKKSEVKKDEPNKDKDKLAQIAKGQEAAKSLSSGKGGGDMSLEALATMSDEEVESFISDPKNWKKLSKAA